MSSEAKEQFRTTVGTNIKTTRRTRKISRDALSEAVGVTPAYIGLIERGERGTNCILLYYIAAELGVSTDYLYKGVESLNVNK